MRKQLVIFAISIANLIPLLVVGAEGGNTGQQSRPRRSIAVLIFAQDTPNHITLHHSPRTATAPPPTAETPPPTSPTPPCPASTPSQNQKFAKSFYSSVIGYRNTTRIEEYFVQHKTYIQHSPTLADGVQALKERIPLLPFPPGPIDFQRVSADKDLVWIHSRRTWAGKLVSRVDILRFECGRIAEHWDIMQDTTLTDPATIANSHPFF